MTTAPPSPMERPQVLALQQGVLPLQMTLVTRRLDKLVLLQWVTEPSTLCKTWLPILSLEQLHRLLRRLFYLPLHPLATSWVLQLAKPSDKQQSSARFWPLVKPLFKSAPFVPAAWSRRLLAARPRALPFNTLCTQRFKPPLMRPSKMPCVTPGTLLL